MKLKKSDAAIIFHSDGGIEIEIPKINPVPDYVIMVSALAILLSKADNRLIKLIRNQINKMHTLAEKIKKGE